MTTYILFRASKVIFICTALLMFCLRSNAQETSITVTGRVVDEYGQPLPNVTIQTQKGNNISSSDWEGAFSITVLDGSNFLTFHSPNYLSTILQLEEIHDEAEVVLSKDVDRTDENVQLGFTSQRRSALSGAVATVSGVVLERSPVAQLSQTFAGRLAGLTTQETFSELSRANTNLHIRGISGARLNGPLVIIDGIPTSYNSNQTLDYISANEIESISVLKDASTQAIHGIQGANGVMVVTTKRGRAGRVEINASMDQSAQQATNKPVFYASAAYAKMRNQAASNDGHGLNYLFTEEQIAQFSSGESPELYPNNNWYDRFIRDLASMQRLGVSATGGNDRVTYFSNINFMHQGGYFKTDQERYNSDANNVWVNYRSNVDMRFNNYLKGFVRLSGNIKRERTPGGASNADVYASIFQLPPTMYGPTTPAVTDPETGEIIDPGGEIITTERVGSPTYGLLNRSGYVRHTVTNINSQFGLDLDMGFLTEGLSLSGIFAYQTNSVGSLRTTQDFERHQRTNDWDVLKFTKKGDELNSPLVYAKGHSYYYHLTYKGQMDYRRSYGSHHITGMAYMLYQNLTKEYISSPELLPYNRVSSGLEINYGFADRYFIKGVTGYSASEQYARDYRYVFTPAVSIGWLASNEPFLASSRHWLSQLKVRASYGLTANDQSGLRRYAYLDNISVSNGGPLGYLQYMIHEQQIGNPLIQPELSTKTNIGLDIGLFNAFSVNIDVFKERMEQMVVSAVATIPAYQGIPLSNYPSINGGVFENQGYEVSLGYARDVSQNVSFNLQATFAYAKNEIVNWNEALRTEDYAYRKREEGFSYGQEFGYLVDYSNGNGFFNSEEELTASGLEYGFGNPRVGDLRYQDLNGDGTIDERDQAPIGYGALPRVNYSFAGGLRYGPIDVNMIFQGIGKFSSIIGGTGIWETEYDGIFSSLHQNAWTPERYKNGEKITWPALSLEKTVNHEASDFINFDRSYLRLRNLEIGYTLAHSTVSAWKMDRVRFVLRGQNLFTLDNMKTKDLGPEGGGYLSFPVYRVFSVGLNVVL